LIPESVIDQKSRAIVAVLKLGENRLSEIETRSGEIDDGGLGHASIPSPMWRFWPEKTTLPSLKDTFLPHRGSSGKYVSIEQPRPSAMVVRGATGRSVTDLCRKRSSHLWAGNRPPINVTDGGVGRGVFVLGGIEPHPVIMPANGAQMFSCKTGATTVPADRGQRMGRRLYRALRPDGRGAISLWLPVVIPQSATEGDIQWPAVCMVNTSTSNPRRRGG